MKTIISLLFLFQSVFAFSQTGEIIKILTRELQKEIRNQKEDAENYYENKFEVVKTISIESRILSMETKKKSYYGDGFYTEKQEVALDEIIAIVKDINIIFETRPNAVKITRTEENGKKSFSESDLFFLHLPYEKHNEYVADELVKVFTKAGYNIEKGAWYD